MKKCTCWCVIFAGNLAIFTGSAVARACGPATTQAIEPNRWHRLPQGELILRSFQTAPYPHPSRQDGYKAKDERFPAAAHYSDSTVGIFIPAGFKPGAAIDVVIHFHGHRNNVATVLAQFDLPGQFHASGVNAILVVPQGPRDAPDSGCGKLELDPDALRKLLDEVLEFLSSQKRVASTMIGRVVLSAHSGGYKVVGAILARGDLSDHITDVLLFDATYGQLAAFADFCRLGRGRRLVSIFTDHLAAENFQLIALLQARNVAFRAIMESDLTDNLLAGRAPLLIHTTELSHNEVVNRRNGFGRFVGTSKLTMIPK